MKAYLVLLLLTPMLLSAGEITAPPTPLDAYERQFETIKNSGGKHTIDVGFIISPELASTRDFSTISEFVEQHIDVTNAAFEASAVNVVINKRYLIDWSSVLPSLHYPDSDLKAGWSFLVDHAEFIKGNFLAASGADILFVIQDYQADNVCGRASIGHSRWYTSVRSNYALGVIAMDAVCSTIKNNPTLAHEIGHILGAHHDREQVYNDAESLPEFDYAYAYQCGEGATIMSYEWPKHELFSTPEKDRDGQLCGELDSADNVKVMNHNANIVAQLSPSVTFNKDLAVMINTLSDDMFEVVLSRNETGNVASLELAITQDTWHERYSLVFAAEQSELTLAVKKRVADDTEITLEFLSNYGIAVEEALFTVALNPGLVSQLTEKSSASAGMVNYWLAVFLLLAWRRANHH